MSADALMVDTAWRRGLMPERQLTVSEWADTHRVLPPMTAEPGRWRTSRLPYLRDIMDALSVSSPIERVVLMKGAQTGGTEAGLNAIGYWIAHSPGLILSVWPSIDMVRRNSRTRIDPLIEGTPILRARCAPSRSKDPGNTVALKEFAGGALVMTGANSATGLRSMPARYLILDEVDAFPHDADGEGDPVALAIQRTVTFRGRRKIFLISTPTIEGVSRIAKAYAESDQRVFKVPCPHCADMQVLRWSQIQWPPGERDKATYICASCGGVIEERHKAEMLAGGRWETTAAGDGRTAGFHLSALYSPFESWAEIAVEHGAVYRDPERLKAWTNLKLGEPFEDRAAQIPVPMQLMARGESWGDAVPAGVVVITVGVDVQQDRIELEVVGWGAGEESWSLAYHALPGNPADPEMWLRLDEILTEPHRTRDGRTLRAAAACVDTGAWSKLVYDYTAPRHGRRVWAIKGSSTRGAPLWPRRPSRPKPGRPPLYVIGSDAAKEIVVARLSIEEPGPGCCHFPTGRDLDYFEMLTAERPIRKFHRGVAVREWVKSKHVRNEALDARCYALAALHGLKASGLNLDREAQRAAEPQPDHPSPRVTTIRSKWLGR
jgi:phage terminase large subunit GpA-like protein